MAKSTANTFYFPELTGIRAVAAFMVYLFHFNPYEGKPANHFGFMFFNELHIGVTLFFVLSGFLIAHRYLNNFSFTAAWFQKYTQNRMARIYPVYFALTVLTFLTATYLYKAHLPGRSDWAILFLNLTFLKGFFDNFKYSIIAPGWSLTVEECFYFLVPVIFYLYFRFRYFYLQPVALLLVGCLLVWIFHSYNLYGFFGSYKFMFAYTFFGRCVEFFVGIKLALILQKANDDGNLKSSGIFKTSVGIGGIIMCILILVWLKYYVEEMQEWTSGMLISAILPVFIALLFYGLIREETWLAKLLRTEIFMLLGKSSYVFYLVHMGIFRLLFNWMMPNGVNSWMNYILMFLFLNLVSILIYRYFEHPINKYLKSAG